MSDRTQDLKNLRAVATACKNYVDETKEQILWQVGQYNITTQDDNTTAYQKIVPTGATRAKIKSIGGMSYKSENEAVIPNISETTYNGITYKFENGVMFFNGTATGSFSIDLLQYIKKTTDINIKFFDIQGTSTKSSITQINNNYSSPTTTGTAISNLTTFRFFTDSGQSFNNYSLKVMVVSGSTPATNWSLGFGELRHSVITSIESKDSNDNTIDTFTIPNELQALTGYGRGINENCYNYIDFENKKFIQKVGRVDLGTLTYTAQFGAFYTDVSVPYNYVVNTIKFLCGKYTEFKYNNSLSDFVATDKSITFTNTTRVWLTDSTYTTASALKNALSGVYLYYELATPIETDISSYIDDNIIEVEAGGYLVFENQYQQAVPSNITYRIEVAK